MTDEKVRRMGDFLEKVYKTRETARELDFNIDKLKRMEKEKKVYIGPTGPLSVELPENIARPAIQQAIEWYQHQYDAEMAIFDKMEFEG
ncbi:MAG: hypothetical protein K6G18_06020 [Treponema sp.]|nr:hypothetical protein [Treponema sp.]